LTAIRRHQQSPSRKYRSITADFANGFYLGLFSFLIRADMGSEREYQSIPLAANASPAGALPDGYTIA
jgi:hypothetical protein